MSEKTSTTPLCESLPKPPAKYTMSQEEFTKQYEFLRLAHRKSLRKRDEET